MSDRQVSPLTARLLLARQRLSSPDKHCQGALTKFMPDGVQQFCVRGAILAWHDKHAYAFDWDDVAMNADRLLHEAACNTIGWNSEKHGLAHVSVNNVQGYDAVMKVLDRAISMSMAKDKVAA